MRCVFSLVSRGTLSGVLIRSRPRATEHAAAPFRPRCNPFVSLPRSSRPMAKSCPDISPRRQRRGGMAASFHLGPRKCIPSARCALYVTSTGRTESPRRVLAPCADECSRSAQAMPSRRAAAKTSRTWAGPEALDVRWRGRARPLRSFPCEMNAGITHVATHSLAKDPGAALYARSF